MLFPAISAFGQQTTCFTGFASSADWLISPMPLGQIMEWGPVWATPMFAIAIGILVGLTLCIVFFGALALLSFIPPLGQIADLRGRGITASLILGAIFSLLLCGHYLPMFQTHSQAMILPLVTIGLMLGFAVIYGMWHRTRDEWSSILVEGIMPYTLTVLGLLVFSGFVGLYFVSEPMDYLRAVSQVNVLSDGVEEITMVVPGNDPSVSQDEAPFHLQSVNYDLSAIAELTIESDKTVMIADGGEVEDLTKAPFRVAAGDRSVFRYEDRAVPPIPADPSALHIQNRELDDATVTMTLTTIPQVPQMTRAVGLGIAIFVLLSTLVTLRQASPRVWALALSTAKNEMAQTIYLILLVIGIVGVIIFTVMPFYTLGDDIRMFKDCTITGIMILAIFQAVWSAGTSVSEEIEGRTALTVLSKPVSRRDFLLGKYLGIVKSVFVMFAGISFFFVLALAYKPIYDARETSKGMPAWQEGFEEILTTVPVLGLYFMQTMVIAAIAVALATRLPLLANLILCFVIYVIGNLTSPLVASAEGNNELVGFFGNLIAVVVPNLNVFNVQSALDSGNQVPWIYVAGAFNYLVCFAVAIWMLSMILFEDRDLA